MLQYHKQNEAEGGETVPLISEETIQQLRSSPTKKAKVSLHVPTFSQKLIEDDSSYKFAGIRSYLLYLKAAGGYLLFGLLIIFFLAFGVAKQLPTVWLQIWLDSDERRKVGSNTMICEFYFFKLKLYFFRMERRTIQR